MSQIAQVFALPRPMPNFGIWPRVPTAWALTLAVIVADAIWMFAAGWQMNWRNAAAPLIGVLVFMAPLVVPRYRHDLRIKATCGNAALLVTFQAAGATLSYLVTSTGAPLDDATFAAWDRALGFDWIACWEWLEAHPGVRTPLKYAYQSGLAQLVVVVLALGMTGRAAQLAEFMRLFILATLVTIVASGLWPAAGAWKHYPIGQAFDLASLSHFEPLRSGVLQEMSLGAAQGLISFPSLHAAMAVLLAHAMRRTWLFAVFAVLNATMLVSTPVEGGHYLVDVLAGVALAAALIVLAGRPLQAGAR